jgi:hypothetical protein
LTDEERQHAFHLFVAPETSEAIKALGSEQGDVWRGRLLAISWFEILSLLREMEKILKPGEDALRPWIQEVALFLNKLGIRPFAGFRKLQRHVSRQLPGQEPLFWRGVSGFGNLPVLDVDANDFPLFYNQQ